MEKEFYTFSQDNGGANRGTVYEGEKLAVSVPKNEAEYLIKKITKWRTAKSYKSIVDRLMKESSCFYDGVILKMYQLGYEK